ncbi:MAG: cold shock domain-containing protein [Flavobacteriales bacterium]|nr:cold shock domain-containing protein [Flavobacteriales bacterium]
MAKSQQTWNKKEKEKKRLKKRQDKLAKKEERKTNSEGSSFEDMIAYVDENGVITDTPPDPNKKKKDIKADSIEIGIPKRTEEEQLIVRKGKVAFFDNSKGYGFITDSLNQEKYFVHVSGLIDEISENDNVTYELEKGMKGMNAVKVKKV